MSNLPWRKPEEKPIDDSAVIVIGDPRGDEYEVRLFFAAYDADRECFQDVEDYQEYYDFNIRGWLYESDLLSDFQRWLAGDKMTPTEPQTVEEQVSPSDSWKDVPDPDKWLRDVRGYGDESGEDRG